MHATVLTNVPFEPDIEDDGIIKSNIAGNQIFDMGIIYILDFTTLISNICLPGLSPRAREPRGHCCLPFCWEYEALSY